MIDQPTRIEPLSAETFERFRELIREKTSINMRESKHILVANRLRRRVMALGLSGYEEYYRHLTQDRGGTQELAHFIDAVSTNETYFYREANSFNALRQSVLPKLFKLTGKIRIWSAGCSTGEEPYTLKILIEEGRGSLWDGEAQIIATDISAEVIRRAREGVYGERSVRFVPPEVRRRFFSPSTGGTLQIDSSLRNGVEFRVHNLLHDDPPGRDFHLIFCRNVMIYFDKPTQNRLADEVFAEAIDSRGYLFVGHSESLTGTSRKFHYVRELKAPIYQKAEGV